MILRRHANRLFRARPIVAVESCLAIRHRAVTSPEIHATILEFSGAGARPRGHAPKADHHRLPTADNTPTHPNHARPGAEHSPGDIAGSIDIRLTSLPECSITRNKP
jgi:hypothetical protein